MLPAISIGYAMRFASISLLAIFLAAAAGTFGAENERREGSIRILVQNSPLAGSQYHRFEALQKLIQVGDLLDLVREPDNPHDRNAVSVVWRGERLGYLPRKENRAVAQAMDKGETVKATVDFIAANPDPWKRLRISVFIEL